MRISFSPIASLPSGGDVITASVAGDLLTVNGDLIDFAVLAEGAQIASAGLLHPMLGGTVERVDGTVRLTLLLPYSGGGHVETPPAVTVANGIVPIPAIIGA